MKRAPLPARHRAETVYERSCRVEDPSEKRVANVDAGARAERHDGVPVTDRVRPIDRHGEDAVAREPDDLGAADPLARSRAFRDEALLADGRGRAIGLDRE